MSSSRKRLPTRYRAVLVADTNVLLRALIDDPSAPQQCLIASEWLGRQTAVYVPQLVQAELVWAINASKAASRADLAMLLRALLDHPAIHLQHPDAYLAALNHVDDGGDFADGIIAFEAQRVQAQVVTFDRKFAKRRGVQFL